MQGLRDVATRLAAILAEAPRGTPDVRPFVPAEAPRRALAVDGSSVVLAESGSHLVGAFRPAAVLVERGHAARVEAFPPEVALLSDGDAHRTLAQRMQRAELPVVEVAPLHAGAALDALRLHEEVALALRLLPQLSAGDLLLVDGAVQTRPPVLVMDSLLRAARERGVDVIGVCKSTSLTVGGAPALAACQLAARGVVAPWASELQAPASVRGRVFVARLSRAEQRPFRFDVAAHDDDPLRALAAAAGLAGHPGYPGYPSPLAMAHHAAVIAEDERRRLAHDVMEAVAARGVSGDAWRAAFLDYHDVLELGV